MVVVQHEETYALQVDGASYTMMGHEESETVGQCQEKAHRVLIDEKGQCWTIYNMVNRLDIPNQET